MPQTKLDGRVRYEKEKAFLVFFKKKKEDGEDHEAASESLRMGRKLCDGEKMRTA